MCQGIRYLGLCSNEPGNQIFGKFYLLNDLIVRDTNNPTFTSEYAHACFFPTIQLVNTWIQSDIYIT